MEGARLGFAGKISNPSRSMNELFEESEVQSLSPRLRWMQKHGIRTLERHDTGDKLKCDEAMKKTFDDVESRFYPDDSPYLAWGVDEIEALTRLAKNRNLKLWEGTK